MVRVPTHQCRGITHQPFAMPKTPLFYKRKSHISEGEIYFWTATIHQWKHLLKEDDFKKIVIDSLIYLSDKGKLDVYGFVIMPNHIHIIWRINEKNGKESCQGSFLKFTAHEFKKRLKSDNKLNEFAVDAVNKSYEFWKRDSLAIILYSKTVAIQKLNYIHNNPLAEHWGLANNPCDYEYSSASFYEHNDKIFPFLKDLWDVF